MARTALYTFLGIVLVGLVIWLLYVVGWIFTADSTNRQGEVNRSSYGFQQSQRDELVREIGTVNTITVQMSGGVSDDQKNSLGAQRWTVVNQACGTSAKITNPLPSDETAWVAANCSAGN